MRIELTNEQYKTLLELVIAGNYMFNRYENPKKRENRYQEVENLILSSAKRAKCYDYFEIDEEGNIRPNVNLADMVGTGISDYNHLFFEKMIAKGDFSKKLPSLDYVDTDDEGDWFDEYVPEEF